MPIRTYFRFGFQMFDEFNNSLTFGSFRMAYADDGEISLTNMKEDTGFNLAKGEAVKTLEEEEGAYLGEGEIYRYVVYDTDTKEIIKEKIGRIKNNKFVDS